MSESFAELFAESLKESDLTQGSIVSAVIEDIDDDWVTVNAGLKSSSAIPKKEFLEDGAKFSLNVGDSVDVAVVNLEDGFGNTVLSRLKARQIEAWKGLEQAYENKETVTGVITGKVRGGFTVELETIRAFLPGSLVDMRPLRDTSHLEGRPLDFKLVKLDSKRNNIVVSRRAVLEEANSADREKLLAELEEGSLVKGIVKNLTNYGAFIDLGGIDGLLHITDLAWHRVKHPSEILNVGDDVDVQVLKFDRDNQRVSLGLKQLTEDPWQSIGSRYPIAARIKARVTNITDYGCFVQLEEGIEGLVHASEMDWTNKNVHPSRVVQVGEEVDVVVLDLDIKRHRISLSLKHCLPNPWEQFAAQHQPQERITGTIKSITDFGLFIGLDGGIDGLVHVSDLSWSESSEEALKHYAKGDEVESLILSIDVERERISLGIKQLEDDPFSLYLESHNKQDAVSGRVLDVKPKGAQVELAPGVVAALKASDFSTERVDDLSDHLREGDEISAVIQNIDRNKRLIFLSVKARDAAENKAALKAANARHQDAQGATTIGDLIKEQLEK